jgi:hypothetical protein
MRLWLKASRLIRDNQNTWTEHAPHESLRHFSLRREFGMLARVHHASHRRDKTRTDTRVRQLAPTRESAIAPTSVRDLAPTR